MFRVLSATHHQEYIKTADAVTGTSQVVAVV